MPSKTARCKLPISVVDDGIIGCVDRVVTMHRDKPYDLMRLSYFRGELDRLDSNLGTTTFTWEKGIPTASDEGLVKRTPGRIIWSIIGRSVADVDDRGRLLRVWNEEKNVLVSRCEYVWQGERLDHIQCYAGPAPTVRKEPVYDCRGMPKLGRSVNRGGALGVPMPGEP